MRLFVGGSWRNVRGARAYVGGQWRRVTRKMVYINGAWRTAALFAPPLTVSVSPTTVSGFYSPAWPTPSYVTTSMAATATPSGGLPPYSYLWTGGGDGAFAPTKASTVFTEYVDAQTFRQETYTVTVTDSVGQTATANVLGTFDNYSNGSF